MLQMEQINMSRLLMTLRPQWCVVAIGQSKPPQIELHEQIRQRKAW